MEYGLLDWDTHLIKAYYSYFNRRDNDLKYISFDSSLLLKDEPKNAKYLPQYIDVIATLTYKNNKYFTTTKRTKVSSIVIVNKIINLHNKEINNKKCFPDGSLHRVEYYELSKKYFTSDIEILDIIKYVERIILSDNNDNDNDSKDNDILPPENPVDYILNRKRTEKPILV